MNRRVWALTKKRGGMLNTVPAVSAVPQPTLASPQRVAFSGGPRLTRWPRLAPRLRLRLGLGYRLETGIGLGLA